MNTPSSSSELQKLRIQRDDDSGSSESGWGRRIAIVVVLLIALGGGRIALNNRPVAVQTGSVAITGGNAPTASEGITANGYVVARTKASVSAKVAGRLDFLGVTEGAVLKKGDLIARIEAGDYEAQLRASRAGVAQVEAQLTPARRTLERQKSLKDSSVIALQAYEDVETQVAVLEAQLESARAQQRLAEVNLENTRVRAPFDGTILRRDAEVGEFVAPSAAGGGSTRTAIVTMADLGTLEVEVDVNEAYIARISGNQPGRIILDAYPDASFKGQVRQVVPTADRQKATVQVKVSILENDPRILPEMGAKVTFLKDPAAADQKPEPRRVMVPIVAVLREGGQTAVWVVKEGVVHRQVVTLGSETKGSLEVQSGLSGGETVVLSPPPGLREGGKVTSSS